MGFISLVPPSEVNKMILQVLFVGLFLAPAALIALYYLSLMAVRLLGGTARCEENGAYVHSFAIVIPAHDEECSIVETLESCFALDYPREKFEVFVIADNCRDRTAEVARANGATCLERHDPTNPGKGQALEWTFPKVLRSPFDSILVLDADCQIDRHALRVFDRCFLEGSPVLQANYVNSNPDAGSISYAARVGNFVEYELFYAPKSDLHLVVMLVGTGMVLQRNILERYPWHAQSVTEDVEYTLQLARHGLRVRFVANVGVRQAAAERMEQLRPQRRRWARGTLGLGRQAALRLMAEGLVKRNLLLFDFAWTLTALSRPLVLAHLLLTVAAAGLLSQALSDPASRMLLVFAMVVLLAQLFYFAVGVAMVGITLRRMAYLLASPVVVLRLAWISLASLLTFGEAKWERTPRQGCDPR